MYNNLNYNILGFGAQPRIAVNTPYYYLYTDGNYQVLKLYYETGSAVAGNGSGSFYLPDTRQIEYLIVGGGGAGGATNMNAPGTISGAGGGAGQLITGSFLYLGRQQFNFNVGRGGVGYDSTYSYGNNGLQSILSGQAGSGHIDLIAIGGGGGGAALRNGGTPGPDLTGKNGRNGGSGGGAGWDGFDNLSNIGSPGLSTAVYGSNGGNSWAGSFYGAAGGGGGATQTGLSGSTDGFTRFGGNGGSGSFSSISGTGTYYAGGGGGGAYDFNLPEVMGLGGPGGGGTAGTNGQEMLGGGGGAAVYGNTVAAGGSGVIYLRWNRFRTNL